MINNIIAYELDNKFFYNDPVGNYADNIKIYFYRLLLNKKFINNLKNLAKDLKLNIDRFIPTPLSSSLATLSEDEKIWDQYALILDIPPRHLQFLKINNLYFVMLF